MKKQNRGNDSGFAVVELLLILVLLAGITGVGYYVYSQRETTQRANTEEVAQVEQAETLPEDLNEVIEVKEVIDAVEQENPEDPIVDIDLESEDSTIMFIVKLKSGKSLYVDAKSAAIVRTKNGTPSNQASLPASLGSLISVAEAQKIALAKYPEGRIVKIELELDDGKWEYEVKFLSGIKVEVSAEDGTVTKIKNEGKIYKKAEVEQFEEDRQKENSNSGRSEQADKKEDNKENSQKDRNKSQENEDEDEDDDGNDDDNKDDDES
jgi:hypothetical protein